MIALLSRISTLKKLLFLMFIIVAGFSVIGVISFTNLSKMNQNINLVYFGSYVKVLKLNNVINSYHLGVFETIYRLNLGLINDEEAKKILGEAVKNIKVEWEYYANSYKSEMIKPTVKSVDEMVEKSLLLIDSLHALLITNDKKLKNAKLNEFFVAINGTINEINRLIKYETDNAYILKTEINSGYDAATQNLLIIIAALFVVSILMSGFIAKSVYENQIELEMVAKKLEVANENLKNLSLTDPMTGLYNRRYFEMVMDNELKRASREGAFVTFFMLDVDHFKLYNDTYGHQMGDEVLKSVAKVLKASTRRGGDYAFRLGGEEFAVFAYGLDSQKATLLAKKILDGIKALGIEHKASKTDTVVTVSIGGISLIPTHNEKEDVLVKKADDALYHAKHEGRNRAYIIE